MFDAVRPAPTPWQVAETTLPPHDLEIFAADSQVIARWDGELLDELGTRDRMREDFGRIVEAVNRIEALEEAIRRIDRTKVYEVGGQPCTGISVEMIGAIREARALADARVVSGLAEPNEKQS